jgi:hypothetical protein
MPADPLSAVGTAHRESALVLAVASVRADGGVTLALGDLQLRALETDEVMALERAGNRAESWTRIRVAPGFEVDRVQACEFHGDVVLGRFSKLIRLAESVSVPSGLVRSTIADCVIGTDALISDVRLLANYVIGPDAIVMGCGTIICEGKTCFGNGVALVLGLQTGGREVPFFAELDTETATAVALGHGQPDLINAFARAVAAYTETVRSARGIVEHHARIRNTPTVRNTYVGPFARIDGATSVADCTLLSGEDESACIESGAWVNASLLQWGSSVTTLATVDRSLLTEHAHVERHGKVSESILGPNAGVGAGEVTSSLVGPFTSLHHQALLISTLWPEGKGNVSYGANVGSNHTSKAPDQELWAGEGMFIGLGVSIKFPADYSRSPYTILASGITTLPQKVCFPFSLINTPAQQFPTVSPAYNEILPAWLLTDNLYALKRNESKYRSRNQARRRSFDSRVFRPDTVDLMGAACRHLEPVTEIKECYTDRDIEGLGKNYLLENVRLPAVQAYRFFTRLYALQALKSKIAQCSSDPQVLLTQPSMEAEWEHARTLLVGELCVTDPRIALRELPDMLEQVGQDVQRSKSKDDERGIRIIDDYAAVHIPADQDPFVRQTWEEVRHEQKEIAQLLQRL